MRPILSLATCAVVTVGFVLAGVAAAQQEAGGDDLVPKRVDRAARVVKALEEAEKRGKAVDPVDLSYLELIAGALDDARAMTKPVTLAELTDEERESLGEELTAGASGAAGDGLNDWQRRWLERAFEGTELSETEQDSVRPIISDWFTASTEARAAGDSKAQSDLKKTRDAELTKAVGKKKARRLINNLNAFGGRGGGR